MRAFGYLAAAALGLGAAGLAGCGDDDAGSRALIAGSDAAALQAQLDEVAAAVADHDCPTASDAVRDAGGAVDALPRTTDEELRQRLREGIATLQSQAAQECVAPVETTPTEPTETIPDDTTTETIPDDTTTEPFPDDTTTETIPTETVPTDTTAIPPGQGGTPPGQGGTPPGQGGALDGTAGQ